MSRTHAGVAVVPMFALALLVQRHFVRGLTLGAIRGYGKDR
jgi:ABC-type glycerol-3-phosphate transport system permease component